MRPEQIVSSNKQAAAKDSDEGAVTGLPSILPVSRAAEMLRAFGTVGANVFDLTLTDTAGKKTVYRANQPLEILTGKLPVILETAERRRWNVIVRPHPGGWQNPRAA